MATVTREYRDVVEHPVDYSGNKPRSLTRKQILVLVSCSLSSMFLHMGISTIPLILPPAIVSRGIPYQYCGMIFAIFAISIVIFEPLQSIILPWLGTKKSFCLSSLLGGICYLSFSLLTFAKTTQTFVPAAMFIRFIEGFYYSVLITASNVIVCVTFPDRASLGFGILEGFVGAGFILGPLVGGPLFKYLGFPAPFILIGISLLITCCVGYFSLDQITGLDLMPRPKARNRLIRDPAFIACAVLDFSMGFVWGIFETSLEPYLATYEKGPIVEGLIFALAYLSYAVMSPFWGFVFRKVHIDYRWVLLGPVAVGVIWMFLGPSTFLMSFFPTNLMGFDTLCLVLLNACVAYTFVFTYDTMLKRAIFCGLEENVATYAMIIAAFFTSIYIGEIVGPICGGYVYAKVSFNAVATVSSLVAYSMAIIASIIMLIKWEKVWKWTKTKLHDKFPQTIASAESSEPDENSPLTSSQDSGTNIFQPPTASRQTGAIHLDEVGKKHKGYGSTSKKGFSEIFDKE